MVGGEGESTGWSLWGEAAAEAGEGFWGGNKMVWIFTGKKIHAWAGPGRSFD